MKNIILSIFGVVVLITIFVFGSIKPSKSKISGLFKSKPIKTNKVNDDDSKVDIKVVLSKSIGKIAENSKIVLEEENKDQLTKKVKLENNENKKSYIIEIDSKTYEILLVRLEGYNNTSNSSELSEEYIKKLNKSFIKNMNKKLNLIQKYHFKKSISYEVHKNDINFYFKTNKDDFNLISISSIENELVLYEKLN